jgi:hypothetical protein
MKFKDIKEFEQWLRCWMDAQLHRNAQAMLANGHTPEEVAEATSFGIEWNERARAEGLAKLKRMLTGKPTRRTEAGKVLHSLSKAARPF